MKKITELEPLMLELLDINNIDMDNQTFSARALEIIKEISGYAKKTTLYQMNKDNDKQVKNKSAWEVLSFMLYKIGEAPTPTHEYSVVILLMPVLWDRLNAEGYCR